MSSEEELIRASRAKDDIEESRCNDESKASLEAIDRISRSSSSSSLFEPNIDMLVNDFDDEHTIAEAEAAEVGEDPQEEISKLKEEGEMPLIELIAKYNYQPPMTNGNESNTESGDEV